MSNWEELEAYKGCRIMVASDEDYDSPRDWDNVGHMVCFHSRYDLGDKKLEDENTAGKLMERIRRDDIAAALPLYLYDHSGITMNTHGYSSIDSAAWDWGQVGFIFVTKQKVREELGCKYVTKKARAWAKTHLEGEVKTYAMYLEGDVLCWKTLDPEGEIIESCGGYYGYFESREDLRRDAKASINSYWDDQLDPMVAQYGEMMLQGGE